MPVPAAMEIIGMPAAAKGFRCAASALKTCGLSATTQARQRSRDPRRNHEIRTFQFAEYGEDWVDGRDRPEAGLDPARMFGSYGRRDWADGALLKPAA